MIVKFLGCMGVLSAVLVAVSGCDRAAARLKTEGGVRLVYEIDASRLPSGETIPQGKTAVAVSHRLNQRNVPLTQVIAGPGDGVTVIVIGQDSVQREQIKRLVDSQGTLEFRILADPNVNQEVIERAEQGLSKDGVDASEARWIPVDQGGKGLRVRANDLGVVSRLNSNGGIDVLVLPDPQNVSGKYLKSVSAARDAYAAPCIDFEFNVEGGRLFGELTGDNAPKGSVVRKLGIIFDERLVGAPVLMARVTTRGQITGDFTQAEVEHIVNVLDSGTIPPLKLVREELIAPGGP